MDRINLVEIVCPEIWEAIFYQLKCPSSLYNCYKTCTTFQNILHPSRNNWLFHDVIPLVFRYMDGKSILACRAACKVWKNGVESFLENWQRFISVRQRTGRLPIYFVLYKTLRGDPYQMLGDRERQSMAIFQQSTHSFYSSAHIAKYMEDLSCHSGNPFPGRTIFIANRQFETNEQFWNENVFQLLSKFGDQIRNLYLEIDQNRSSLTELYNIVRQCLLLTSNLRRLHLKGWFAANGESITVMGYEEGSPELPQLETIEFSLLNNVGQFRSDQCHFPLALQHYIAAPYATQLKKLIITFAGNPDHMCRRWMVTQMPKLEEISVKVNCYQEFESLFSPECTYIALRSVTIEIVNGAHKLGDYLNIFVAFRNSLTVLIFRVNPYFNHLTLARPTNQDVKRLSKLHNLEYLQIDGFKFGNVNVSTRLPKKLKYLLLDYDGNFSYNEKDDCIYSRDRWAGLPGVSAALRDEQGIYMSALWKQARNLDWLCISYSSDPRRVYMYRRENREWWMKENGKWQDGCSSAWRDNPVGYFMHRMHKTGPDFVSCGCFCCWFCCCGF